MKKLVMIMIGMYLVAIMAGVTLAAEGLPEIGRELYKKGEIIIKLKSKRENVGSFVFNTNKSDDISFGISSLDEINARLNAVRLERVFRSRNNYKILKKASSTDEEPLNLSRFYIVKFDDADVDIEDIVAAYRADPNVESASLNYLRHIAYIPDDSYYSSSGSWGQSYDDMWGLKPERVDAESGWDISNGDGAVVAIVDTGIDVSHEDLSLNIWTNDSEIPDNGIDDDNNGYVDDYQGWDFVGADYNYPEEDNVPDDKYGHGTHCAGTIAAVGDNGIGVVGLAYGAKIIPVKGLDDTGWGSDTELAKSIVYAVDNGADVINCSWGGPGTSAILEEAINYAHSHGCVIVVAAGNNNEDAMYYSPANITNAITVAASDVKDKKASFSNWGSKIDVAAPGVDILSLRAEGTDMYEDSSHIVGDKYYRSDGTSMAAPHVSGLSALIISHHPEFTNEDIRQVIRSGADDIGNSGWDEKFGHGRINAGNSLAINSPTISRITDPVSGSVIETETLEIKGSAYGNEFSYYILEYGKGRIPSSWNTIVNSTNQIINGSLGVLDVPLDKPGLYTLRLKSYDINGFISSDRIIFYVPYEDIYFEDVAQEVGVAEEGFGSGACFLDVDNDGYSDLYITKEDGPDRFFINNGDSTFSEWMLGPEADSGYDVSAGDYNNDGYKDILVIREENSNLYYNDHGVSLIDKADEAGVDSITYAGNIVSVRSVFTDYNLDGFVDMFVGYGRIGTSHPLYGYLNSGHNTFVNIDDRLGVEDIISNYAADVISFLDYDNDDDLDMFVARGGGTAGQNLLFRNNGYGTYSDVTSASNITSKQRSFISSLCSADSAIGDYDNDGYQDILAVNRQSKDFYVYLYHNRGNGRFEDVAIGSGLHPGQSVGFFDFDNDGYLDIFQANDGIHDIIYLNQRDGTFLGIYVRTALIIEGSNFIGNPALIYTGGELTKFSISDYDNDGDLDIYISRRADRSSYTNILYRNQLSSTNNWIKIKLEGRHSNIFGLGAKVKTWAGSLVMLREAGDFQGMCSSDGIVHFGLGENQIIDKIEVIWPSGVNQTLENINVNQTITIQEPETNYPPPPAPTNLSAKAGEGKVTLTWQIDTIGYELSIAGYNVYRSKVSGGSYVRINSIPLFEREYIDEDVINGNTYYYVVTSLNRDRLRESSYSNEVSALPWEYDTPEISNLRITNVTSNSFLTEWITNEPTTFIIDYGLDNSYGLVVSNNELNTVHSALIKDLNPDTKYHLRITVEDNCHNKTRTSDITIATTSSPDPDPITIYNLHIAYLGKNRFDIFFSTDKPATSTLYYGLTESYGNTKSGPSGSTKHLIEVDNLEASTLYYYQIKCSSGDDIVHTPDRTITTASKTLFNDVTIESNISNPSQTQISLFFDYNNDGYNDLYILNTNYYPDELRDFNILYKNNGPSLYTFSDVTEESLLIGDMEHENSGATYADYDGDGYIDILILKPHLKNYFYKNMGNGTFMDVSEQMGIDSLIMYYSTRHGAFFDYDNDGYLDLLISSYQLLHNNQNQNFTPAQDAMTLDSTWSGAIEDYDNDGDLDFFVLDKGRHKLLYCYRNNGNGTFTKIDINKENFGIEEDPFRHVNNITFADYDNDGDMDLYVTCDKHKLYRNMGSETGNYIFTDASGAIEAIEPYSWEEGADFFDVDNDGDLDILIRSLGGGRLLLNQGPDAEGRYYFREDTDAHGLRSVSGYSGWASNVFPVDYDKDGDIDIYSYSGSSEALYNNSSNDNHWLRIKLRSSDANSYGVGARVKVTAGEVTQTRTIGCNSVGGPSTTNQNSYIAHFGLGQHDKADIEVTWPGKRATTILEDINADQILVIHESSEDNHAPQFNLIEDKEVYEYDWLKFTISATDADGDNLTYGAENLPEGATFNAVTREFTWQPIHEQIGTYNVTFSVFDGQIIVRQTMNIEVLEIEDLPPNVITLEDFRLYIQYILPNGAVTSPKPYKIKGVCWSPSSIGNPGEDNFVQRKEEFYNWYETDIPLMKEMGVNTVRTYLDFGTSKVALDVLNELYKNGIMVIMAVDSGVADQTDLEAVVNFYKDHPAILMWAIGNEWNSNLYYGKYSSLEDAMLATEDMAQRIKELDSNHPVSSILGHRPISEIGEIVSACPSVDIWGVNAYLGASLHGFLEDWKDFAQSSGIIKPIFISELGADAYDIKHGRENQKAQSDFNNQLWWEIYANLSADNATNPCLGATYFEWNDEWWKAGEPSSHDTGGFYAAQPDGYSNEEWYGLVNINRNPRQVYYTLKGRFTSYQIKDTIKLKAQSNEGEGREWNQWARFYKDNAICYSGGGGGGGGRGMNVAVLDRKFGYFEAIEVFDTWTNSSASQRLIELLSDIEDGKIVMMAVADEASNKLTQDAIETIESTLGSNEIRNLEYWGSWAIISIKGTGAPLAEAIDNNKWADLTIEAIVGLDTDGDGIINSQDLDDDNDGISDEDELNMGTDPLDHDFDNDGIIDSQDDNIFAPKITLPDDIAVAAGETIDITIQSTDVDGNVLIYKALGLPASANFYEDTGRLYWETSIDDTGAYRIIVIVSDGKYYDYGSFIITVKPAWVLNMTEMDWYENIAPYRSTGAATSQMILNYIREGAGEPLLTQDEIYEYARDPEPYGPELTPDEVDKALGHFDPYDYLVSNWADSYDSLPDGNPYQGYNYSVETYDPNSNPDAINEYMRDISHWMAYTVTKEDWRDDGELVARPNTPAAIPIYGTYDHWVAVKGCITSKNPAPDPHINPWNTPDFTIYGFWMKDPLVSGIGQNTYKTASECKSSYFLPLTTGDAYDGLFLQVAEPPAEMSNANVNITPPNPDLANLAFIGVGAETKDYDNATQLKMLSFGASLSIANKTFIKKQSWKDIVDPYLLTDSEAVAAFEGSDMGEPILVKRLDREGSDYYLVPFGKLAKEGEFLSSGAIILDADEGYFKEASWTENPEKLIKVDREKAISLIRRKIQGRIQELQKRNRNFWYNKVILKYIRIMHYIEDAEGKLVWEPNSYSPSVYRPYWRVDVEGFIWYVTQDGEAISEIKPPKAPSDLAARRISATSISFSWRDNSNDEDGFVISRSIEGAQFEQIASVGANVTSYTDSGLLSSTRYSYKLEAYNIAGISGDSNILTARTKFVLYIRNIWPRRRVPGMYLHIYGRNFGRINSSSRVYFEGPGGSANAKISYWRDYYVRCIVPQLPAGKYSVKVINSSGKSNSKDFEIPPPYIRSMWPASGTSGIYMYIYGKDFGRINSSSRVYFEGPGGSANAKISYWRDYYVRCIVPQLPAGIYNVKVINSTGQSNTKTFEIILPHIRWMSPSKGRPGRYLRIVGKQFGRINSSSRVYFEGPGGSANAKISYWRNYYIRCIVPQLPAGEYSVRVINAAGESNSKSFKIL